MIKKIYTIPIMQVIRADIEIKAFSKDEALDLFHEMDEAEMGYPFDFSCPHIEVDESESIGVIEVGEFDYNDNEHYEVLEKLKAKQLKLECIESITKDEGKGGAIKVSD